MNELSAGCMIGSLRCDFNKIDASVNPMDICSCSQICNNNDKFEYYIAGKCLNKYDAEYELYRQPKGLAAGNL